jgi:hypothetical protein
MPVTNLNASTGCVGWSGAETVLALPFPLAAWCNGGFSATPSAGALLKVMSEEAATSLSADSARLLASMADVKAPEA